MKTFVARNFNLAPPPETILPVRRGTCTTCQLEDELHHRDTRCTTCFKLSRFYGKSRIVGCSGFITENGTTLYVSEKAYQDSLKDTPLAQHVKCKRPIIEGFAAAMKATEPFVFVVFPKKTVKTTDLILTRDRRRISVCPPMEYDVSSPRLGVNTVVIRQFNGEAVERALDALKTPEAVPFVRKHGMENISYLAHGTSLTSEENDLKQQLAGIFDLNAMPRLGSSDLAILGMLYDES